jgi:3-hydroxyacyl-[acyl-carrier-protein] dehydratase
VRAPTTAPGRLRATPIDAVDDIVLDGAAGARATKLVRLEDPYLNGHYPGFPIYPGVFVVESVVQTHRGACLARGEADPGSPVAVSSLRLTAPLFPGDILHVRTTAKTADDGAIQVRGVCEKDGRPAARVTLVFAEGGRR